MAGVRRRCADTAHRSATAAAQTAQPALRSNPIARTGLKPLCHLLRHRPSTGISFCSTACGSGGIEAARSGLLHSRWSECRWCHNRDSARPWCSGPPTIGDRNRGRRASAPRRPEWPRRAGTNTWDRSGGRVQRTYPTLEQDDCPLVSIGLRPISPSLSTSYVQFCNP
jgi:hypothetical protein